MAYFADINVSPASVATYARCGGIFDIRLTANLKRNLPVKKNLKSVLRIDRIMVMCLWPRFFGPPCTCSRPTDGQTDRQIAALPNAPYGRGTINDWWSQWTSGSMLDQESNHTESSSVYHGSHCDTNSLRHGLHTNAAPHIHRLSLPASLG